MNTTFLGSDFWGLYFLRMLIKRHRVTGIVTTSDNPGLTGEGERQAVPVYRIQARRDRRYSDFIRERSPELIVSAGFPRILRDDILTIPSMGAINIHGSYLPAYRGPQPLERQIINGEACAGVTIHYIEEGIDNGDILAQEKVSIAEKDTLKTMMLKLSRTGGRLLKAVVSKLQNGSTGGVKQDESRASYYAAISEKDCEIDWTKGTKRIYDLIRGLPPYAPAFSDIDRFRCFFFQAMPAGGQLSAPPGRIVREMDARSPMIVSAADGNMAVFRYSCIARHGDGGSTQAERPVLIPGKSFKKRHNHQ